MYKPPVNTNRVKSIKNKFENIEKNKQETKFCPNGTTTSSNNLVPVSLGNVKNKLSRQSSDPTKCNIKRTPAFRVDKNSDKCAFQRLSHLNKSNNYSKILKPSVNSALNNNCDKKCSNLNNNNNKSKPTVLETSNKTTKPVLIKAKSSIDFSGLRRKFENTVDTVDLVVCNPPSDEKSVENQRNILTAILDKKLTDLYTEPIPKSLRLKTNLSNTKPSVLDIESQFALKSKHFESSDKPVLPNIRFKNDIYNASTLKLSDKKFNNDEFSSDTIKYALKKPLPCGPAPKKPPRTFTHLTKDENNEHLDKNKSFLYMPDNVEKELISGKNKSCLYMTDNVENEFKKLETVPTELPRKADPKYMLNKLETALRNNKLRVKKQFLKPDLSGTSGEDSDDSLLILKSNISTRSLPLVPDNTLPKNNSFTNSISIAQALNLNCLNLSACSSSIYEKAKEANSSFFVSCTSKSEEPVYAEPFHEKGFLDQKCNEGCNGVVSDKRNSLYYLSSPVLCTDPEYGPDFTKITTFENDAALTLLNSGKVQTPENSSLSSCTSESAASSPMEEKSFHTHDSDGGGTKIKNLIDTFENKHNGINRDQSELDHRVDDVRSTIQRTIESSFLYGGNRNRTTDGSNGHHSIVDNPNGGGLTVNGALERLSVDDPTVDKFRTYVKKVSIYSKFKRQPKGSLFYCCLIVQWHKQGRQIKFKFPPSVNIPHKIEDLCFPEATNGPLDKSISAQCYSLMITDDKGERTFGYCRRVIPEGSLNCLPIAYCILSKHKAPRFYKKILIELESRHGISEYQRSNLMSSFYFNAFPNPGESVRICLQTNFTNKNKDFYTKIKKELSEKAGRDSDLESYVIVNQNGQYGSLNKVCNQSLENEEGEVTLNLHHDPVYENSDLKPLHQLPNDILKKVFASLLLERKVILISCVLCKLSSCVEALQTILYPFSWPHTFIPILPQSLWEFVESPTPIICGILSVEVINAHEIEHALVVDLDEGCVLKEEGDEDKILSSYMLKAWHKSLAIAKTIPEDLEAHSYHLSDAYLHMFIVVLRDYKQFIVDSMFQKEAFIRSGKTRGVRRFLKWFTDTTLFLTFIDSAINDPKSLTLFNRKIAMYGSETSGLILDKLLDWKR